MFDFVLWLLFGRDILLTQSDVALPPTCTIIGSKAGVITSKGPGATLVVEIPYGASGAATSVGIVDRLQRVEKDYPKGRIRATFYRGDQSFVEATNSGTGGTDSNFVLFVSPPDGFKKGEEFDRIKVCADPGIASARLYWRRISK
jgi:hypothetical protein